MSIMKEISKPKLCYVGGIFLVWFLTGCATPTYEAPTNIPVRYPVADKIPLSVELRLTDELRAAQTQSKLRPYTMLLGVVLSDHAEAMSRQLFSEVTVAKENVSASAPVDVDATLLPKPVAIERTIGFSTFGESILTVVLEWTLTDSNGQLVWVDTIKGQGVNIPEFFPVRSNMSDQIVAMVKGLFKKSHVAISNSPEIRALAGFELAQAVARSSNQGSKSTSDAERAAAAARQAALKAPKQPDPAKGLDGRWRLFIDANSDGAGHLGRIERIISIVDGTPSASTISSGSFTAWLEITAAGEIMRGSLGIEPDANWHAINLDLNDRIEGDRFEKTFNVMAVHQTSTYAGNEYDVDILFRLERID